jgi:mono/diheme cytochrome c family protein
MRVSCEAALVLLTAKMRSEACTGLARKSKAGSLGSPHERSDMRDDAEDPDIARSPGHALCRTQPGGNTAYRNLLNSMQPALASFISKIGAPSMFMRNPFALTHHAAILLAVIPIAAAIAGPAAAQQSGPAFTEAQVERGRALYQKNCQDCHGTQLDNGEFGGAPLKGSYFRQHWGSGDVAGLFGYVSALMPPDRPGQLSPQSYVDLTAFLLSSNGYAAGGEELTADPDAQRRMSMKK